MRGGDLTGALLVCSTGTQAAQMLSIDRGVTWVGATPACCPYNRANLMRSLVLIASLVFAPLNSYVHAQLPAALIADPAVDKTNPATMESFQIPSHDGELNVLVYVAAGAGPHPTVVLLHGFPGNEKNLDLAQAIRRAGWDVLWFNYRGSWGSPGAYSFTHAIEDTDTALAYLHVSANAARLRVDPARIVLAGHSIGGFVSTIVGARHPELLGVGLISAASFDRIVPAIREGKGEAAVAPLAASLEREGLYPLAGCTATSLAQEAVAHALAWSFPAQARGLAAHPLLVISSDDGLAPATDDLVIKVRAIQSANPVTAVHLSTDHSYSDHRIALEAAFLNWLATLTPVGPAK
jgi:pimeloyl-ACP methyl ester carboxylesterase